MTVIVKLTSGENKADQNVSKGFELIPIAAGMRVVFSRDEEGDGWLNVHGDNGHGEQHVMMAIPVLGNAYVMDSGKTIASFSSANIPDPKPIDPLDYYRGQSDVQEPMGVLHLHGDVKVTGSSANQSQVDESYPDDITDPQDERLKKADSSRVNETYKTICMILAGEPSIPDNREEHIFVMGLAAAIESFRAMKTKHRPAIGLSYIGSVVCYRDKLNKLRDHFRLADSPVSLDIRSNDDNYITEYSIQTYYNRNDVDEAEMLLLRNLRSKQTGLVKNVIDKLIKYYKAGVSVVPLEPATLITNTQREQIKRELYKVLGRHFSFILADEKDTGENPNSDEVFGPESALYTHVVIRFDRG